MIFLKNDYSEGMHPNVLQAVLSTNDEKHVGYGYDEHTENACNMIKNRIGKQNADVFLLVGGTQTNLLAISSFLRPVEAVIATNLAHIAVHETGAIENTGHKIIEMPCENGKMTPEIIDLAMSTHTGVHMVVPKLVFISNATETGSIYSKAELLKIREKCDEHNLYLYLDGARLGVALASEQNDLTIEDIADICDAFYIGGTKNGAMFGEAMVILNDDLKLYFKHYIKQKGALLAKGRFLGVQFEELIKDDLFINISKNANDTAKILSDSLKQKGYKFTSECITNQIFVEISEEDISKIRKFAEFEIFNLTKKGYREVRFVTSFATTKKDVYNFLDMINNI